MSQQAEWECAVIGACLIAPEAYDRVAHMVAAIDFEDRANRVIWQAIESMAQAGEPIDAMTVAERLERDSRLDAAGGLENIVNIQQSTPSAANAEHYAKRVHDRAAIRHLAALCRDVAQKCEQGGADADSLALEAETRIHKLATAKRVSADMTPVSAALMQAIEYIDARQSGEVKTVKTGIKRLDSMTGGGFLRGSLNVVAARPSQGKTALGLTLALGAVHQDHQAAFVSIEMPMWQIGLRILSMEGGISAQSMLKAELSDHEWTVLTAQLGRLQDRGLYLSDASSVSIPMLRAMVSRQKRTTGLDLVVVDYLQLMQPPKIDSREQQVAAMSAGLKAIAKEFDVAMIVLAQLNRDAAGRRPRMSDIRESGAVEQDADVVMLIHREDVDGVPANEAEIIIDKNRNGETGACMLVWRPEIMRFAEFAHQTYSGVAAA